VQWQQATDALAAGSGGTVIVLGAGYNFSASYEAKSNVAVVALGNVTVTSALTASSERGVVNIRDYNNVTLYGINFVLNGATGAITSFGHTNLLVDRCTFTGSTTVQNGVILLEGNLGTDNFIDTRISNCKFYDMPNILRSIRLYARNGNIVQDTYIYRNKFENTTGPAVYLDCFDYINNTNVYRNTFTNLKGGGTTISPGVGLTTRIAASGSYFVNDLFFDDNYYTNSILPSVYASQEQGLIFFYEANNVKIRGNTAYGSYTALENTNGPCIAPGRITYPSIGITITDNTIEGFNAAWDPDSMENVEVANNIVQDCGLGFHLGYGIQVGISIHDNVEIDSTKRSDVDYQSFSILANSSAVKCKIYNNTYIETVSTSILFGFVWTGLGASYDHSDVIIENNRFYLPNGTFTGLGNPEFATSSYPQVDNTNELTDSTGTTREYLFVQGNVTGATTFNRAAGAIITATLTGNITVTLTDGQYKGQILELRLTQNGVGSKTATWPANFKKAGGTLTLSTGAGAIDEILMSWDGTNWNEIYRSLNLS